MRRLPLDDEHRLEGERTGRALPAGVESGMDDASLAVSRRLWRRVVAMGVVALGALIMWLSPDQLMGAVTLMAGIALEVLGIHLEHA